VKIICYKVKSFIITSLARSR